MQAQVKVVGGKELRRAFKGAGKDAQKDLRKLQKRVATIVKDDVKVPRRTGRLAKTLRSTGAASKATVKLGGARAPYARINHFGGGGDSLYMFDAAERQRDEANEVFFAGLQEILGSHGLDL